MRFPSASIVNPFVPAFLRFGTLPLYPIGLVKVPNPLSSFQLYITFSGTSENRTEFSWLDHTGPSDHSKPSASISIFALFSIRLSISGDNLYTDPINLS